MAKMTKMAINKRGNFCCTHLRVTEILSQRVWKMDNDELSLWILSNYERKVRESMESNKNCGSMNIQTDLDRWSKWIKHDNRKKISSTYAHLDWLGGQYNKRPTLPNHAYVATPLWLGYLRLPKIATCKFGI